MKEELWFFWKGFKRILFVFVLENIAFLGTPHTTPVYTHCTDVSTHKISTKVCRRFKKEIYKEKWD